MATGHSDEDAAFRDANRPPRWIRDFCNRVASGASESVLPGLMHFARTIATGDGSVTIPAPEGRSAPGADVEAGEVGIWGRRVVGGEACFVRRRELKSQWSLWADLDRIPPKSSRWRIVLIGESTARGYLFDPLHSPARVLQALLDARLGTGEAEVIDLARSNLGYEVRELAISAMQLEPDAVVVFAGNNWCLRNEPTPFDLLQGDMGSPAMSGAAVRAFAEHSIREAGSRVISDIASTCRHHGVPLVWVVPEFNLGDWRDPVAAPPISDHSHLREWYDLHHRAEQAMQSGYDVDAELLAGRMVELDEGLNPAGLYVLAGVRIRAGDVASAREYLERAKDAAIWETRLHRVPRPYTVTQRLLRQECPAKFDAIVDVPALFRDHLSGGIPDRRLFVDYCHLSSTGMDLVMRQVVNRVLPFHPDVRKRTMAAAAAPHSTTPPDYVEAEAALLAAIYNAHLSQGPGIVLHYCERALAHSAHIGDVMLAFVEGQAHPHTPLILSEAGARLLALTSPLFHHYAFRGSLQLLDEVLISSFIAALAEKGIDAESGIRRAQQEAHSVTHRPGNLLDPYFASSAGHAVLGADTVQGVEYGLRSYHRALQPNSRFVFIGTKGVSVRLSLTYRLRSAVPDTTKIRVSINKDVHGTLRPTTSIASSEIVIGGEFVRDGINELRIDWPFPTETREMNDRRAAIGLLENRLPELRLVFAEIHELQACRAH